MFRTILVPLDFTDKNALALETACRLSDPNKGQIILIHVIERIEHLSGPEIRAFYKKLQAKAIRNMTISERNIQNCARVLRREILFGRRADEIVSYARKHKVDLIVMSSHQVDGSEPVTSWATVSHVVAVLARCSTMLVK